MAHARKGDPMPCPECAVGTCVPCHVGNHADCSNGAGAIVGCTCTHEVEPVAPGPLGLPVAGSLRNFD